MGTIMACIMLLGALFVSRLSILGFVQKLPQKAHQIVGLIVLLGGAWNVFWYALRHLTSFWGVAALISGVLMMISAGYLINSTKMPSWLTAIRPLVALGLLGWGAFYAWTIYSL